MASSANAHIYCPDYGQKFLNLNKCGPSFLLCVFDRLTGMEHASELLPPVHGRFSVAGPKSE